MHFFILKNSHFTTPNARRLLKDTDLPERRLSKPEDLPKTENRIVQSQPSIHFTTLNRIYIFSCLLAPTLYSNLLIFQNNFSLSQGSAQNQK